MSDEPKKPGFFARLFGRREAAPAPPPSVPTPLAPPAAPPVPPEPAAAPIPAPIPEPAPTPPSPAPVVELPPAASFAAPVAKPAPQPESVAPAPKPKLETIAEEPAPPAPKPAPKSAPRPPAKPAAKPTPRAAPAPEPVAERTETAPVPATPPVVTAPVETVPPVPKAPETPAIEQAAAPLVITPPDAQVAPPAPPLAPAPAAPVRDTPPTPEPPAKKKSWWTRLSEGLSRTSGALTTGITDLFTKRKLDAGTLEDLEDILIQADLGVDTAARISKAVGSGRYEKGVSPEAVRAIMAQEIGAILSPVAKPLLVDSARKPFVILMAGVNGSGKTTTIGKLAAKFRAEGKSVMLAAGDTFRAAAIEQLKVWGERTGAAVIAREQGSDASGLAFDALTQARDAGTDVLLIDTAGRLQNRAELMAELAKIVRVIRKVDDSAPHAALLVLDATVGQNAHMQVEAFRETAGVTGLVMTKLDGTARGGILVALAAKFGLPVHFIGVGEGVDDLEPFDAADFARAVAGLERLS